MARPLDEILGKWAVIDIETSGVDPHEDSIIDVGYLQFEGGKLIESYSSLVHYSGELSQFVQKLTGIHPQQLKSAPSWSEVREKVKSLQNHVLLAHNASFEEGFLGKEFMGQADLWQGNASKTSFADSMTFLGLLFPYKSQLSLESFIKEFQIADHETHRGYQDSLDLLKVLLVGFQWTYQQGLRRLNLQTIIQRYGLTDSWYYQLFQAGPDALRTIATEIDFDLPGALQSLGKKEKEKEKEIKDNGTAKKSIKQGPKYFPLEFSGKNIQNVLQDEDKVRERLPFYAYRQSQESLAIRTGQSFKNGVHALIQAPTGTGKTLGYLLPAALFGLENKKQVLVATGTKTLQNQAISQDIPQLRKLLELSSEEFQVARLVGSGNHLCELQFRKQMEEMDLFHNTQSFEERYGRAFMDLVFLHNASVSTQRVTDSLNSLEMEAQDPSLNYLTRDDLPYVLKKKNTSFGQLEKDVAVDFRTCVGNKCPFQQTCSYIQGLRRAKEADLIVGNHALMFSWPKGFPRPEYIVVDEAHRIESEATSIFTLTLTQENLESLQKSLENMIGLGSLFYLLSLGEPAERESRMEQMNRLREEARLSAGMLKDHIKDLPLLIENYFKRKRSYTSLYWNELPMITKNDLGDPLSASIYHHLKSVDHIIKSLYQSLIPYLSMWDERDLKEENKMTSYARFEAFMVQLEDIQTVLGQVLSASTENIHSLKYHEELGPSLESAPIDVGMKVYKGLLETSTSVVFTSATLGNAGGDQGMGGIEWPTGYSYVEKKKRFKTGLFLPAVYDYKRRSKVFLCDDTLELYDSQFVGKTLQPIIPLIHALGGRSLLLFSAKTRFEESREVLLKQFEGKIPLFIQGMGNSIVEEFKNAENGILLGMEAFGEGIDIPGNSLQFIFIDKIPDLRMDLVIQERRTFFEKTFGNEFTDYFLAHRARNLHQKLGRLLRTDQDHGGVIIVDSRVKNWKLKTQENFQKLMEPYEVQRVGLTKACQDVLSFINSNELELS